MNLSCKWMAWDKVDMKGADAAVDGDEPCSSRGREEALSPDDPDPSAVALGRPSHHCGKQHPDPFQTLLWVYYSFSYDQCEIKDLCVFEVYVVFPGSHPDTQ